MVSSGLCSVYVLALYLSSVNYFKAFLHRRFYISVSSDYAVFDILQNWQQNFPLFSTTQKEIFSAAEVISLVFLAEYSAAEAPYNDKTVISIHDFLSDFRHVLALKL